MAKFEKIMITLSNMADAYRSEVPDLQWLVLLASKENRSVYLNSDNISEEDLVTFFYSLCKSNELFNTVVKAVSKQLEEDSDREWQKFINGPVC